MNERDATWKAKDGRIIPVREMSDEHLFNTLLFLMRQMKRLEADGDYSFASGCRGEMASYYAEGEQTGLLKELAAYDAWINLLKREMDRRCPPDPWGD